MLGRVGLKTIGRMAVGIVALAAALLPTGARAQAAPPDATAPTATPVSPPPANDRAAIQAHDQLMARQTLEAAYNTYGSAVISKNAAQALQFLAPGYVEVTSDGASTTPTPDQLRQKTTDLFRYSRLFISCAVDTLTFDSSGNAIATVRERQTASLEAGTAYTQTDSQFRDYLTQDGGTWRLSRRRILKVTRKQTFTVDGLTVLPTPAEAADPVFGPDATQPVIRYTFGTYLYSATPLMRFYLLGQTKTASRTLLPGKPASYYAKAFADICTELGVKNKLVGNQVYVAGPPMPGMSQVEFTMVDIHK